MLKCDHRDIAWPNIHTAATFPSQMLCGLDPYLFPMMTLPEHRTGGVVVRTLEKTTEGFMPVTSNPDQYVITFFFFLPLPAVPRGIAIHLI